ncbi:hypothetical protein LTR15_005591 [Elasticomyces elasticus]|nr:hypothetical protein LTR15_005591 [Elasticomyces elasticus]
MTMNTPPPIISANETTSDSTVPSTIAPDTQRSNGEAVLSTDKATTADIQNDTKKPATEKAMLKNTKPVNQQAKVGTTQVPDAGALSLAAELDRTHINSGQFDLTICIPRDLVEEMMENDMEWFWELEDKNRHRIIEKSVVLKEMIEVPFVKVPIWLTLKERYPGDMEAAKDQDVAEKFLYSDNTFIGDDWEAVAKFTKELSDANRKQLRHLRIRHGFETTKHDVKSVANHQRAIRNAWDFGLLDPHTSTCKIEIEVATNSSEKVLVWTEDPLTFFQDQEAAAAAAKAKAAKSKLDAGEDSDSPKIAKSKKRDSRTTKLDTKRGSHPGGSTKPVEKRDPQASEAMKPRQKRGRDDEVRGETESPAKRPKPSREQALEGPAAGEEAVVTDSDMAMSEGDFTAEEDGVNGSATTTDHE